MLFSPVYLLPPTLELIYQNYMSFEIVSKYFSDCPRQMVAITEMEQ